MKRRDSEEGPGLLTAANILTIARMAILPAVIAGIVNDRGVVAVVGMGLIVATDLLDGRIARRLHQESAFGQTLDSTIDFVVIYSLFIVFYAAGRLAGYQFGIIYLAMFFQFLLQLAAMAASHTPGLLRTRTGKLTGALQYLYLLFLVAREVLPAGAITAGVNTVLFNLLAVSIIISSIGAALRIRKMLKNR